jgi:GNAT acetyltransferase
MTITNFGTDVLASLPDLPRWVGARGMLMARRGFVVDTADGCRLICGRKDRLVVPTTVELSPLVETTATREVPGASILLQDVMLPAGRYHLPDWKAEAATVYTLPPDRARGWALPKWPTSPMTIEQIDAVDDLPALLRDQLRDAVVRTAVWSASKEGQPVAFAYAAQTTEGWFDMSVDTLEGARNQGLGRAAAMGLIVDRMLRGLRPVWSAVKSNEASHGLARRLGFEPVDLLWVLTRDA